MLLTHQKVVALAVAALQITETIIECQAAAAIQEVVQVMLLGQLLPVHWPEVAAAVLTMVPIKSMLLTVVVTLAMDL
jgi:hypothetical protein